MGDREYKEGDKLVHVTGKDAEFIRYDYDYVWVKIDGVETPILETEFDKKYVKK